SGVDRLGFRFEYRLLEEASAAAWTSVTSGPAGPAVEFGAVPGVAYAYRVTALDAAGNAAVSEEKSFTLPDVEAAALHARLK
ncbi:MAG: fibronectin type III domain-containing protein, partial [Elusimicrobia bacterium]|nr:fibronectin type III domain-containing protein [Elusimicrobiota bacterium]